MKHPISILVVDDSAVAREMLSLLLTSVSGVQVKVAPDPIIALEKMRRVRPAVIVLDLQMPRMDGITFLRKVMAEAPTPVVICSAFAAQGTDAALEALAAGAVDVIPKPSVGLREFFERSGPAIVETILGAARAHVSRRSSTRLAPVPRRSPLSRPPIPRPTVAKGERGPIVALGASAGGTEAIARVLEALPPHSPGIVIVQHIAAEFIEAFAKTLRPQCQLNIKVAAQGDRISSGTVFLAPGRCHTLIRRAADHYFIELVHGELISGHRPSVDALFHSAAEVAGPEAIGVLLTGMGADGAEGLLDMRQRGAITIAQDEATCVVFGMPREAIERGAALHVAPLGNVAPLILTSAGAF